MFVSGATVVDCEISGYLKNEKEILVNAPYSSFINWIRTF